MNTEVSKAEVCDFGRPINEIIRDLSKPISPARLKKKTIGGREITFLTWHDATKFLDWFAPGWEYQVRVEHIAGKVVAIATITIPTKEGRISRQATGYENDNKEGYGDPFSNAESMALRRAAAKFGLGRYLYEK
jgi:hypothetical protein